MTAQEEYWYLVASRAEAISLVQIANDNLQDFFARHKGETFKVFSQEMVLRAATGETVEPWEL